MAVRKAAVMSAGRITAKPDADVLQLVRQKINLGGTTKTIASGVITVDSGYHKVETEGGGSTDDLVTINGGSEGDILILTPQDNGHTIVVKHGTGNIRASTGVDFTMDDIEDAITLMLISSFWYTLEIRG